MTTTRLHYWNFCFEHSGPGPAGSTETVKGATRIGWLTKFVNEARIEHARKSLGMPNGSVLLAVSYLGQVTPEQMRGDEAGEGVTA